MDERVTGRNRRRWRPAASVFDRVSAGRSALRIGSVHPGHRDLMEELAVHHRRILHLLVLRSAMKVASRMCFLAVPWCREHQLLAPEHVLRWGAETALVSGLGKGFTLGARLTPFLLRLEAQIITEEEMEAQDERAKAIEETV